MSKLCTSCGFVGLPKKFTKGSFLVELILWLFMLLPGLIYSIWRLSSQYEGCPQCEAKTMIPLDSPVAKTFLQQHQPVSAPEPLVFIPPPTGYVSPSVTASQKKYRVCRNGREIGALTVSSIRGMLSSNSLSNEDTFFDEGTNEWAPLFSIPELS